jgi:acyl-CoA synthetase (AMP-forming)/AMP-acid ligase II
VSVATAHNERGSPSRLDWLEVAPVPDLLVRAAASWPSSAALIFPNSRQTYSELKDASFSYARSLLRLGVARGERVAIFMPNCPAGVAAFLGCTLIGSPAVLINARFKSHELEHVLSDSGAVLVLTCERIREYTDFEVVVTEALVAGTSSVRDVVVLGRDAFEQADADVDAIRETVRLRDEALMLYTSGTTAAPKGCPLTHESIVRRAMAAAERWELTSADRFWNPLPLYHIGGVFPFIAMLSLGARFVSQAHFVPEEALELLAAEEVTFAYPTFPAITRNLIAHPDFARTDVSSVRLVLDTGSPDGLAETESRFPNATVITLYGMTEAGGGVAFSHLDDPPEKRLSSAGRPLRGTEVRIVEPGTDADVPAGRRGEILVRSPGVFDGYHNAPEATAATLREGWLRTGDLGVLDEDGRLTYVGRLKEMLKVGGENVAAAEIEAYLATHPAVKIAQVVGVPDAKYHEVAAAFVELVAGFDIDEEEIVGYCKGRIASFKVPRYVRFVKEWPMSASKIQKYRLRDAFCAELELDP